MPEPTKEYKEFPLNVVLPFSFFSTFKCTSTHSNCSILVVSRTSKRKSGKFRIKTRHVKTVIDGHLMRLGEHKGKHP